MHVLFVSSLSEQSDMSPVSIILNVENKILTAFSMYVVLQNKKCIHCYKIHYLPHGLTHILPCSTPFYREHPTVNTFFSGKVIGESAMNNTNDVGSLVEFRVSTPWSGNICVFPEVFKEANLL